MTVIHLSRILSRPASRRLKQIAALVSLTFCCSFVTFVLVRTRFNRLTSYADSSAIERVNQNRAVRTSKYFDARNLTEEQYYRRQEYQVNEFSHEIILAPRYQTACSNDTKIIVLIHSHPSRAEERQAIRHTWGLPIQLPDLVTWPGKKTCCRSMRLFFILGSDTSLDASIRDEQSRHDDIFQGSFVDTRRNSTLKSLFGLQIVTELCPSAKYLLKSEDSIVLNVPLLLERLDKLDAKHAIVGQVKKHDPVIRDDVKFEEFSFQKYPPYAAGSVYFITADVVPLLLETSHYVPYVPAEDVYVTGILARIHRVNHLNLGDERQITVEQPYSEERTACDIIQQRLLFSRNVGFEDLIILWRKLRNPSTSCGTNVSPSVRKKPTPTEVAKNLTNSEKLLTI